ncbi:MAG: RNA polymerase sigma factor [Hyphomicrobiales bacterium]
MEEMAALLEPHIPALRRYARALLRDNDAADDLVQDCLERAIGRWYLRRRHGELKAWLFTIQRNLFLSRLRQRARRGTHLRFEDLPVAPASEGNQMSRVGLVDVFAALDALPEDQRSVLVLVGVEDMSYEETARILDIPVGTVMSRLSRARERLAAFIEGGSRRQGLRRVK